MSGVDVFEQLFVALVEHLRQEWATTSDRRSPLGELAAEAAALLQFYREQQARKVSP